MQRSRKVLLILVLLAGIYLLLPFSFGIVAQRYATQFLKNENDALGNVLGIHLDFAQYNRGWFSSSAIILVERKTANGDMEIINKIPVRIEHGPSFISKEHFRTGLGMVSGNNISLGEHSPYDISFRENIGFAGEHAAVILLNPKSNTDTNNFTIQGLRLNVASDISAKKYVFHIIGKGLEYKDPAQSLSLQIQNLQATLNANYLGKQDWQLTFGLGLDNNQLSAVLPDNANTGITVNLDQLHLSQLHFDTQKMAKLVSDFIQLKQADDSQQPAKPAAWMALFQQLLTNVIGENTQFSVSGLKISTPMGQLQAQYSASFPTLPKQHDYFDIATRDVGVLSVVVPNWNYTNAKTNDRLTLSNLNYQDTNNTVFLRNSKLSLDALTILNLNSQAKTPSFDIAGLLYQGSLQGDTQSLTQSMNWQVAKLCVTGDCAKSIHGKLELANLNFNAFRGIAKATQSLVQPSDTDQASIGARWMDVGNAYAKLILPKSRVDLTHEMITPQGPVQIKGQLSWPNWNAQAAAATPFADMLKQSNYHLQVEFPAEYVNAFIAQQQTASETAAVVKPARMDVPSTPISAQGTPKEPPFEMQAAEFLQYAIGQGYLKKAGSSYLMSLAGSGNAVTINGIAWKSPAK